MRLVDPGTLPEHLRAEGCLVNDCHVNLAQKIATTKNLHEPLRTGPCKSCHQAHGDSQRPPELNQPVPGLCFSCHKEFGTFIQSSRYLHTPIREGRCTQCHDLHGTDFVKLVSKLWPPSEDEYGYSRGRSLTEFCNNCHGQDLISKTESDVVTRFRNGTQNLHASHSYKKLRQSCKVCHDIHAANQPFHIRPKLPYGTGGWQLPISFTKTDTGGSCVVGCHKIKGYDRVHPTQ